MTVGSLYHLYTVAVHLKEDETVLDYGLGALDA